MIMALFGFDVQIHQSHAPKNNFPSVRPRGDFFYSLNDLPISGGRQPVRFIGWLGGPSGGRWENLDRSNADSSAGTALQPLHEASL